jgi:hypothetical protein
MKSFRNYLLLIVSVFGLFLLTGIILSSTYEDAVIKYLKKYLDKHLTTEIEVSRIKFSFIKKFPNATIELRNIVILSGTGFNHKEFSDLNTDTLLSAKSVFFEFSLPGVLQHEYKLKNIRIIDGNISLLIDSRQKGNYNIWEVAKTSDQEDFALTLQNIILSNTEIKYADLFNKVDFDAYTRRLFIRADLKSTENFISSNGYLNFHHISIGNSNEINEIKLGIDLKMKYHEKHYVFLQSSVHSGKFTVNFNGEIENVKNTILSLNFQAKNASIRELENYYPAKLSRIRENYTLTGGLVDFKGSIKGVASKQINPRIDVSFHVSNASVTNQKNREKLSGILMDGDFSNGSDRTKNTASLHILKFSANQGKSTLNGAFKIKGFNGSDIELLLHSEIQTGDFMEFLNVDTFEYISGVMTTDVFLKGYFSSLKEMKRNEILSIKKQGLIVFKEVAFKLKDARLDFRKLNGNMILDDIIQLRDFSFMLSENDFKLDCNLNNLPQYLFNKESLWVDAKIKSDYLDIKSLFSGPESDTSQGTFIFPKRIYLKSDFNIDRLSYGKFTADSIEGFMDYEPPIFHFETFRLHAVDGIISGNADLKQTTDKKISIICTSKLYRLDIQKLFYATNNFGQDVIPAKNLKGELSGNVNFTSEWDSNIKLIDSAIIANSDIEISNGQLIDYEPMLGLARFVNVEELKDIKFKTLRNQILINNRKVIIPEMDIHSSAFNITGSGIHYFDNHYDYRIQVQLNELLSSKAKKQRKEMEEFGIIEDDGLVGLNIPIKIIGKGINYHVEFDRKRAIGSFKSNINSEKEEIKNLFKDARTEDSIQNLPDNQNKKFIIDWDNGNEKKDFIFEEKDHKKKEQPRFIIQWDEDDNTEKKDTIDF